MGVGETGKREAWHCQIRVDRNEMLGPQDLGGETELNLISWSETVSEKETLGTEQ